MQRMESDWYRKIWTLDIRDQSWVEDTRCQIDFLAKVLRLTGSERILDLACGFGRHSLELARRGFSVTGVDITPSYVEFAQEQAQKRGLNAQFICSDIREVQFENEFDVVLNMADGAVGYLENDGENQKIFEVIAKSLKPGGKHFMDIMNGGYAKRHFPCNMWDAGEKGLTLSRFEWDSDSKTMLYGQQDYVFGQYLSKPVFSGGNPIRLYTLDEIEAIYQNLGMRVVDSFSDFLGNPSSDFGIQLLVYSVKEK